MVKRVFWTAAFIIFISAVPAVGYQDERVSQDSTPTEHARTDAAEPVVPIVASRSEQLRRMRTEKMKRIQPYRQGKLESGMLWVEQTGIPLLTINVKGFQPRIGGLPTGAGLALGTHYTMPYRGTGVPDIQGTAAWTLRGYQEYDVRLGKIGDSVRGTSLYVDLRYQYFPQEDFFGIGPNSSVRDRTDFTFEQASYEGVVTHSFTSWLHASGAAGVLRVNTGPGTDRRYPDTRDLFNDAESPGLAAQPDFLRLSSAIAADYRDTPGNPHAGGVVAASYSRYSDWRDNLYTFNRFEFDTQQYIPLGSSVRILALRLYASSDQADGGSRVPFYFQQTLGGGDTLRGFREYRFRGPNLLYMSGEYRWEPVRAVELAVFYDAGRVFSRPGDFDVRGLRKAGGAGIRFKTSEQTILRVDAGRSDEGTRIYFKFGRSF